MTLASSYKPLRPEPTKEEIDALVVQYLPLVKYVVGRLTIPVPAISTRKIWSRSACSA
ncbi:MAG: hypothetical protein U1E76_24745 [Planctomycetota bacterium]